MSTQGATERRRRILTRAIPLVVLASTAFAVGAVVAAEPVAPAAQRLLDAWERDDYAAMHAELTPEAREEYPLKRFKRIYTNAAEAATTDVITVDEVREGDDTALAPVSIATHAFGNLRGELALPIADGQVAWTPNLVYPGLAPEERLSRTRAPQRAPILAADRTPLAEGPAAARTLDAAAVAVVGETGTRPVPRPASSRCWASRRAR